MDRDIIINIKDVSKSFANDQVIKNINLYIKKNEFLTLLGPSGCGKTTLLRMIAGFEDVSRGEIIFDGQIINNIPVHKRPIDTVFQNYALFPHMDVYENIAFGLKLKKLCKKDIKRKVKKGLKLVNLEGYEKRSVKRLSGGQQQRVAIARALVNEPRVLLLDEPLGALDLKLRQEMQIELKEMQERLGLTFIFVTHDQEEALTMSDTIVVLNEGVIQQIGSPEDIYNRPRNCFVAKFIGASNIVGGRILSDGWIEFSDTKIKYLNDRFKANEEVDIVIRPEDLKIVDPQEGTIKGIVEKVSFKGIYYEMTIRENQRIWTVQNMKIRREGELVGINIEAENIHIMKKTIEENEIKKLDIK